jgi:hypothetical protein
MKTRKSLFSSPLILVALAGVMALAVACGDDDSSGNPAPNGGSKAMGGSTSGGKTSTGGKTGTAGKTSTTAGAGNEPATGGAGGVEEPGTGGAGGAPDCTDETDNGCFSCKPKTLTDFLNACPTTGCEKFDNTALTSAPDGALPNLP